MQNTTKAVDMFNSIKLARALERSIYHKSAETKKQASASLYAIQLLLVLIEQSYYKTRDRLPNEALVTVLRKK